MKKKLFLSVFVLNTIVSLAQTTYRLELIGEGNFGTPNGDVFVRNTTVSPAENSGALYQTVNSTVGLDVLQDYKVVGNKAIMVDKPVGPSTVYVLNYPSMELIQSIPAGMNGGQTIGIASPTKAYISFGSPSEVMLLDLVDYTLTAVSDPNNAISTYSSVMAYANGHMYVQISNNIVKIDTLTNTVVGTITPGLTSISGLVVDDAQEKLWVMGGANLKSIDLLDNETVSNAIIMPVSGKHVRYYDEKIYFWSSKKMYIYDIAQSLIPTVEVYTSSIEGSWDFGYGKGFDIDQNTGDFVITSASAFTGPSAFEVVDGTTFEVIESSSLPGCIGANNCRLFTYHAIPGTPVPDVADLPVIEEECEVELTAPTADNGTLTGTTDDPVSYTEQGTYTVVWTFTNDIASVTQTQTIVINDVTAPVIDLSGVTIACTETVEVPVALDNCAGEIAGTTTDATSFDVPGTHIVNWTFDDGNGNVVVKQQVVTVVCSDLGIEEKNAVVHAVFPVPADQTITVSLNGQFSGEITIVDAYGNKVLTQAISGSEQSIDVSAFSNGVYFLSIAKETMCFTILH